MNSMSKLLDILGHLDSKYIHYQISNVRRPRSLRVTASAPGFLWEIEVLEDGAVEVEVFRSNGTIFGEESLVHLLDTEGERKDSRLFLAGLGTSEDELK